MTTTAAPATAAAFTARQLRASQLKVGDLVVGPGGAAVRVTQARRSGSRVRLRYNHPETGVPTPFAPVSATAGHPGTRWFVVLARGVSAGAVRHTATPQGRVLDGGAP